MEKAKQIAKNYDKSILEDLVYNHQQIIKLCSQDEVKYAKELKEHRGKLPVYQEALDRYDEFNGIAVTVDLPLVDEAGYPTFADVPMSDEERKIVDTIRTSELGREGALMVRLFSHCGKMHLINSLEKKNVVETKKCPFMSDTMVYLKGVKYPETFEEMMSYRYRVDNSPTNEVKMSFEEYMKNPDSQEETNNKWKEDQHK